MPSRAVYTLRRHLYVEIARGDEDVGSTPRRVWECIRDSATGFGSA
jgi:hypothetical protein